MKLNKDKYKVLHLEREKKKIKCTNIRLGILRKATDLPKSGISDYNKPPPWVKSTRPLNKKRNLKRYISKHISQHIGVTNTAFSVLLEYCVQF